MIGGDAEVGDVALAEEVQDRLEHAPDGTDLVPCRGDMGRDGEEVAEQLIGPVE